MGAVPETKRNTPGMNDIRIERACQESRRPAVLRRGSYRHVPVAGADSAQVDVVTHPDPTRHVL